MKLRIFAKLYTYFKQGIAQCQCVAQLPSGSSSRALKPERTKVKRRSKSPETLALSMSSSHNSDRRRDRSGENNIRRRDRSGRSKSPSTVPPLKTTAAELRRSRRPTDFGGDNHGISSHSRSNDNIPRGTGYLLEYESPTESMSSSLSSFPVERNNLTNDKHSTRGRRSISKEKLLSPRDESTKSARSCTVSSTVETAPTVLSSETGTMIEVSKITALVEEELQTQRLKHRDQLNRTVAKFKDRREKFQREMDLLRAERDEAWKELENYERNQANQKRAAERNDRFQYQQKNRIEILEEQKEMFEDLQEERDALLDEVARTQQQQEKTREELQALKVRVREDSQKRLSVMECLSTSWDSEKKEAQQKEALLNTELDMMAKTLKAEQEYLKNRNNEFAEMEEQYRSMKTELRSIKMTMIAKKEEMDEELRREQESSKRAAEEQRENLKLSEDHLILAETTIRTMKSEFKSVKEKFSAKEELMARSLEGMKLSKEKSKNDSAAGATDLEAKMLRDENSRLDAEVKELQKQIESYLANMALQQEFCDSLKSRIYSEQEKEQEHVEELHKLRKRIKKQQKEATEKDIQIGQLKDLIDASASAATCTNSIKVQSKSARDLKRGKRSSMKKSKSQKSGYRTS